MSGDQPSRAGRLTALATLAVSATLFVTALLGISSIDPAGDAAIPANPMPETKSISFDPARTHHDADDCPERDGRDRGVDDERAPAGPRTS